MESQAVVPLRAGGRSTADHTRATQAEPAGQGSRRHAGRRKCRVAIKRKFITASVPLNQVAVLDDAVDIQVENTACACIVVNITAVDGSDAVATS